MKSHTILLLVAFAAAHLVITEAGAPTNDDLNADKDAQLEIDLMYLRELTDPYDDHLASVLDFVVEVDTDNTLALNLDQMKGIKDRSGDYTDFFEETKLLIREIKKLLRDVSRERDEADEESGRIQDAIDENAVDYTALRGALTSQLISDCYTDAGGANGYRMFENICLKMNDDYKTFDEARSACQALGMDLATVYNAEMDAFIVSLFYDYGQRESSYNNYYVYWLGGRRPSTSHSFSWVVSGQPLSSGYEGWDQGEPNNLANENCLHYWRNDMWNDIPCDSSFKYLCQRY